jgi:lipoate---protein ligase
VGALSRRRANDRLNEIANGRGRSTALGRWDVSYRTASAAELHAPWPVAGSDSLSRRGIAVCSPVGASLVLGSSQKDPDLAESAVLDAGLDVTRRSSGGGAVLVSHGAQVWIDVWLPRGDVLWDDDVVVSSAWLGDAWHRALSDEGLDDLTVSGASRRSEWSELVCFAGLGPGEVLWKGRKLVGLSQRRTRHGARFLTMSPMSPVGAPLLPLLHLGGRERASLDAMLGSDATSLEEAFGYDPGLYVRIIESVISSIDSIG